PVSGMISILILSTVFFQNCSQSKKKSPPAGPPFPDLPAGTETLKEGRYIFKPRVVFYRRAQAGEMYVKESSSRPHSRFYLNIAGIDRGGNFRLRTYTGRVHKTENKIDFRSEECFLFGKKNIEERLAPMESWDCDHLIFAFEQKEGHLKGIRTESTKHSNWAGHFELKAIPQQKLYAAQILDQNSDGSFIAYGMYAPKKLNPGHIMNTEDGRFRVKVLKRYGDFIICKPENKNADLKKGTLIYTTIPRKTKSLFDG
ncbi:MAG: hypothetical protein OEZ34_06305, partial [Spirochaetia bacterium]|nr:hypothetical protein [Spirochaetia bacterium]